MSQPPTETYTPGYTTNASNFMAQRTAATHAAFLLPHLRAGMRLLDCGCGPGTITLGLAKAIAPGRVDGIDLADSQIALARAHAAQQQVDNVEFQTGSIYDLPFEPETFDAVFAHAVMEHLKTPLTAFQEIRRMLKPGGVAGVSSPDWGGFIIAPANPTLDAAVAFYKRLQTHNGGDPDVGRKLGTLARDAGFARVTMTASYECYANLEAIAEYLALRVETASASEIAAVREPDTPTIAEMANALRELGNRPDGLFAQTWVAVVAWAEA